MLSAALSASLTLALKLQHRRMAADGSRGMSTDNYRESMIPETSGFQTPNPNLLNARQNQYKYFDR
jgi:hypothetical protein